MMLTDHECEITLEITQESINPMRWNLSTVHHSDSGKVMNAARLCGDLKVKTGRIPPDVFPGKGKVKNNTKA